MSLRASTGANVCPLSKTNGLTPEVRMTWGLPTMAPPQSSTHHYHSRNDRLPPQHCRSCRLSPAASRQLRKGLTSKRLSSHSRPRNRRKQSHVLQYSAIVPSKLAICASVWEAFQISELREISRERTPMRSFVSTTQAPSCPRRSSYGEQKLSASLV